MLLRHTQNYGNALLNRIRELLDRNALSSKDKKTFLTGTISSIFIYIRNLFAYQAYNNNDNNNNNNKNSNMKSNGQESFKSSLSFYSNNPMLSNDKDKSEINPGNKNGNNKKGLKDDKSAKSVKSDDNFQNNSVVSNIQLERCMRFIVNHDSSNASKELCSMLIDIVVKICTVKSINSSNNISTTAATTAATSSLLLAAVPIPVTGTVKAPMRSTTNTSSSRSNNNNNNNNNSNDSPKNKDNVKNKQKLKPWDNLLAAEKFLVDEICSFFGDTIGGSRVVSEKLDIPLGAIATQYWRVSDGKVSLLFVFCFLMFCDLINIY